MVSTREKQTLVKESAPNGLDQFSRRPSQNRNWLPGLLLSVSMLFCVGTVFGIYHQALSADFLLDDFKHLNYIYNAFNGDPSGLLRTFCGNWSGGQTDGLTSFRPGISLSFCPDFFFSRLNPVGYHITNLLVFSGCMFFVGLAAFQLSKGVSTKSRMATGVVAAILFAAYPIHVESVAWIIGRVDLHCTFFYLASLCFYLQYRASGALASLVVALSSFVASLFCKEMAVSLPAVIGFAELLLAKPLKWKPWSLQRRSLLVGVFVVTLMAFAVLRTLMLGTLVGGYGQTDLKTTLRAFTCFFNPETIQKILFGVNEELPFPARTIAIANYAWAFIGVAFIARLGQPLLRLRVPAFVIAWMVICELPTFQIWHIFPNLVGSRLFFVGSCALSILLAVVLIPPLSVSKPLSRLKLPLKLVSALGVAALFVLTGTWYQALVHNLFPWVEAGNQIRGLRDDLIAAVKTTPPDKAVVVVDLPQDLHGSGLVGRSEYLETLLSKPLADSNYADRIASLERPLPGSHDYTYPNLVATIYGDARVGPTFLWDKDKGRYSKWTLPEGGAPNFEWQPSQSFKDRPAQCETFLKKDDLDSFISLSKPTTIQTYWLPCEKLDPIKLAWLRLAVESDPKDLGQFAGNVRLVWRSDHQPKSWIDFSEGPFSEVDRETLLFVPHRSRNWALNGNIRDLGIRFYPGNYTVKVKLVTGGAMNVIAPSLSLDSGESDSPVAERILLTISPDKPDKSYKRILVNYDASTVSGAKRVQIAILKNDFSFEDQPARAIPQDFMILFQQTLPQAKGSFQLPEECFNQKGKHQVAVLALGENGEALGYLSEPRTYIVK